MSRLKKGKPVFRQCPVCHGPLVHDRLEQEFPPVAHASSKSEPSVSVADILRELGAAGSAAGPGDSDEARGWPLATHAEDVPARLFPLGQRRISRSRLPFDTLLGLGAVAAIIVVIITLGVGIAWNDMRTPELHATVAPVASRPNANSGDGSVDRWSGASILASLPASVPGGWHRWESDASLTQSGNLAAAGQRVAAYQRGVETVHVWLLKTPESRDALTAFGGAARFIHAENTLLKRDPVPVRLYGHDCLSFTDDLPATVPHYIEASHPFAVEGFTLTWYRQGTLITIASEDQKARDDFASAYAPQH